MAHNYHLTSLHVYMLMQALNLNQLLSKTGQSNKKLEPLMLLLNINIKMASVKGTMA